MTTPILFKTCSKDAVNNTSDETTIGTQVDECDTRGPAESAEKNFFISQWNAAPAEKHTRTYAQQLFSQIESGTYQTTPSTPDAKSDWEIVKAFGRLSLDASELIAPLWLMTDYKLGLVPNSVVGILLINGPASPGPEGGSFIYGNEPEWLARISQTSFIGSNFLFSSVTRPNKPQDPEVNSSQERIAMQKEFILPPLEIALGAARQFTNSQILLRTAGEPESPFESVFASLWDTMGLFSTAYEQTHGPKGETLETTLQNKGESDDICNAITIAKCERQTKEGKPITGGVQALNSTITAPLKRATGHMLESTRINYRLDLMTRLKKQFGNKGLAVGGLIIGMNYFISVKTGDSPDDITEFGYTTERGKRIKAEGAQIPLDIGAAILANGETDYVESFSLTLQRIHDLLKQYYPAQMGELGTQWDQGADGVMGLGMDPAMLGFGAAAGFLAGKHAIKGYTDYKRDNAHPGDVRNKIDWTINVGLDILDMFSTYGYVNDPENHVEGKKAFTLLVADVNAKQLAMITTAVAIGARYGSYLLLGPLMADSPVKVGVGPTSDGAGFGFNVDLGALIP